MAEHVMLVVAQEGDENSPLVAGALNLVFPPRNDIIRQSYVKCDEVHHWPLLNSHPSQNLDLHCNSADWVRRHLWQELGLQQRLQCQASAF